MGAVLVVVLYPCVAIAQQDMPRQQPCAAAIPSNIEPGVFAAEMQALLRRSDTFRAQCARIAADRRVRITLAIVSTLDSGRAQTTLRRYRSGTLEADVSVLFGEDYRELLAHEFEHVIEQIDGVNLRQEVAEGRAWLLPGGAFETSRALATGVRVVHEVAALQTHPAPITGPALR
jgi:hypothetical protein